MHAVILAGLWPIFGARERATLQLRRSDEAAIETDASRALHEAAQVAILQPFRMLVEISYGPECARDHLKTLTYPPQVGYMFVFCSQAPRLRQVRQVRQESAVQGTVFTTSQIT
jgi:hypothetical protein